MVWTPEQILKHKEAAVILHAIMREAFDFIKKYKNTTEFDVQQFILKRFKYNKVKSDRSDPIVAFRKNSSFVHYFPKRKSEKIKPNSLILIDIWARLEKKNSPFADITWMAYYGKRVPAKIKKVFDNVLEARGACVVAIQKNLKNNVFITGKKAHELADQIIIKHGFASSHFTGHSIGFRSPHGSYAGLTPEATESLKINLGYTIEPGIYLKDDFGIRSEIDFYIDEKNKMHITSLMQDKITLIK